MTVQGNMMSSSLPTGIEEVDSRRASNSIQDDHQDQIERNRQQSSSFAADDETNDPDLDTDNETTVEGQQQQRRRQQQQQQPPEKCTIQPFNDDGFSPTRDFHNTAVIQFAHSRIPRFGHTSDVTKFIIGPREDAVDYRKGLTASSIAIVAVVTTWIIVLAICKYCLRRRRVGWLAGHFRPIPPRPIPKSLELFIEESTSQQQQQDEEEAVQVQVQVQVESEVTIAAAETSTKERNTAAAVTAAADVVVVDDVTQLSSSKLMSSKQIDISENGHDVTAAAAGGCGSGSSSTSIDYGDSEQPQSSLMLETVDDMTNTNDDIIASQEENGTQEENVTQEPSFLNLLRQFADERFRRDRTKSNRSVGDELVETKQQPQIYDERYQQQQQRQKSPSISPTPSQKNLLSLIHDLDGAFHMSFSSATGNEKNATTAVPPSHSINEGNNDVVSSHDGSTRSSADASTHSTPQGRVVVDITTDIDAIAATSIVSLRTGQLTTPTHIEVDKETSRMDINSLLDTQQQQEEDQEDEIWLRHYNRIMRMHTCFRVICWWCALAVVVGSVLMIIIG
jgi:hypothetical protein